MHRLRYGLFLWLFIPGLLHAQVIIHNINFNTDVPISVFNDCGDGTGTFGPGAGGWVINDMEGFNCDPNCGNNQGGDARNYFTTIDIDVSGYCDVSVTATFSLDGSFECPPPSGCGDDFLQFEYTLDGNTQLFENNGQPNICICGTCSGNTYMSSTATFTGNTVSITVTGGCQALSETITINEIVVEGFDQVTPQFPVFEACANDPPFLLTTTNGVTGTFSGPGVTGNNMFDPGSVGPGNYQIDFQPDPGQCATDATTTVSVLNTPVANPAGPLEECESGNTNEATFDLTSLDFDVSGGNGTVSWYEDQNLNVPINNPGNYTTTTTTVYAVVDNGVCTSQPQAIQLVVLDTPIASPAGPLEECDEGNMQATFDLTSLNNTIDNTGQNQVLWFQDQGGQIPINDPGAYTSFNGVVYAFVDNGQCRSEAVAVTLTVVPTEQPQLMDASMCSDDPPLDLNLLTDPQYPDGTWTGPNVTGDQFDPGGQEGTFTLTFTPDGTCVEPAMNTVTVTETNSPQLTSTTLCTSDPLFDLNNLADPNYPNGVWNGPGVNGDQFDPSNQMGDVTIEFTASAPCSETASTIITVVQAGTPMLSTDTICTTSGPYDLAQLEDPNFTGTWSGTGVNGDQFNPDTLAGTNTLTFIPDAGCADTASTQLEVVTAGTPQLSQVTLCPGEDTLALITLEDPSFSGSWEGNGVSGDEFIRDTLAGTITLQFIPDQACVDTASTDIQVVSDSLITERFEGNYCQSQSVTINGTVYDENNPAGRDTLSGASASGCDSIIIVDLVFADAAVENLSPTLCPGDSILINGTAYHENNTTGSDTIPNGSAAGCDSIINVNLSIYSPAVNNLTRTLCFGQQLVVNGTVYDENNPTGSEILPGASINGCDSTINVQLNFEDAVVNSVSSTLCPGESLTLNGILYDENNPTGMDTIPNGSVSGCDSVIQVNLNFYPTAEGMLDETLCPGESITVNGTVYDENNPTGAEILPNASVNGCDSTVTIDLQFHPPAMGVLRDTFCTGDNLIINGTQYDESNPTGQELLIGASTAGCDSTLLIDLTFLDQVTENITSTLCANEEIIVNGVVYDENNPAGQEVIPGGSAAGCDSVIQINLSFYTPATSTLTPTECSADSVIIQGTTFWIDDPTGTIILPGASVNGCDSIIDVTVTFSSLMTDIDIQPAGCGGQQTGSITIQEVTGTGPFVYSLNGDAFVPFGSTPFRIDSLAPGTYDLTIQDTTGCSQTQTLEINQSLSGMLDIGPDITINTGGQTELLPVLDFTPDSLAWSPGASLSCSECLNPVAQPDQTTTYILTVIDENGCLLTDSLQVVVVPDAGIYLPNAFSPNEDGINDRWTVFGSDELLLIEEMHIYNRWGDLLYSAENLTPNDPARGWDGTRNGEAMLPGVYVFWVRLQLSNGDTILEKGNITLIR